MKTAGLIICTLISISSVSKSVIAAPDKTRQEIVAEHGVAVMPFDLNATTHIFTKTKTGGTQKIVVKRSGEISQIRPIRAHLAEIADLFSKGDFSGPIQIHGAEMPGLAVLQKAQPSEIKVKYQQIKSGAKITYTTKNPELVAALHEWFDAQLTDHGSDAMEGHDHSKMHR